MSGTVALRLRNNSKEAAGCAAVGARGLQVVTAATSKRELQKVTAATSRKSSSADRAAAAVVSCRRSCNGLIQ